ncbi:cell cycle checkpoint control protein RAD9A-like isoform X2 [Tripterygium wilfordii]|uniref:cell cycle checkpoint control protein RAD9A-like isoform X2 n=1 Tax=Tripterygium wilfordii TaxID=458696 RepID=UPI0018F85215|nr:cell cycle checkpoint control protein RAD9A-like isoform X2 [Tripterygium wilfordii]
MEFSLSGNALKTFARSITCLARVGNELAVQASPSQLAFHTLNSSRSAYQSITFKPSFFDVYTISGSQVQCSVLLKAVCSVLRTPIASIDNLSLKLPEPDASKVQWTLDCCSGMRKTYWIACNVEPDIQHLSLDRRKFPSNFVVRPRDLNRLLANFQSSLQEITIIATEPTSLPSDAASEIGGKAVELRSYMDPTKEEFVQYTHTGDPVDITFGVKELKAFLSLCEGCEVDIHLYFEKAGEPILLAPKFDLDDVPTSNFDATLVLATMLTSQLHESNSLEPPQVATTMHGQAEDGSGSHVQQEGSRANVSEHPSDHTRIWSELSGSAVKSSSGLEERRVLGERTSNTSEQREIQRISRMKISKDAPAGDDPAAPSIHQPMDEDHAGEAQDKSNGHGFSQRHPSNWVDAGEDEEDDDGNGNELCVQSTPPYYEEQ